MKEKITKKSIYNSGTGALLNKKTILEVLYFYKEISRASIANITGLTRPSITNIIKQFLDCGLVKEMRKAQSESGRKQQLIGINPDAFNVIVLEIERSYTKFGLYNSVGEKIKVIIKDTPINSDEKNFTDFLFKNTNKLIVDSNVKKENIFCCSIGVPGPVDSKKGFVRIPNIIEKFKDSSLEYQIKEIFEKEYGFETFVENDANCSILGEKWFGIGKEFKNYVFITSDMFGLGSGIVIDNILYKGSLYSVGEIGHTLIKNEKKDVVKLEDKTGYKNIALLLEKKYNIKIKKEDLITRKIKITHEKYSDIAEELSFYVGLGIVNMINLFAPEAIIIGGKLLDFYDVIYDEFNNKLKDYVYSTIKPKLLKASLGYESGIVGAVALSFEKLLNKPDKLIDKCLEIKK